MSTHNVPPHRFVVAYGHTLGCIYDELPCVMWILAASILKGAIFTAIDGRTYAPDESDMRPATRQDFKDFRINPEPYNLPE